MNRSAVALAGLVLILPVAVEVPGAPDSLGTRASETRLKISGGSGYYAFIDRGCEGQVLGHVPVHYREAGAELEHRFSAPIVLGVRGGWIRDEIGSNTRDVRSVPLEGRTVTTSYLNPHFALDRPRGAIGIGWVAHDGDFVNAGEGFRENPTRMNDVSFHLRLGRLDSRYFSIQWMESVPLYSGGGYFNAGLGGRPARKPLELYGGLSAGGPYDGGGLVLRANYELKPGTWLDLGTRLGESGRQAATGISLGLEYRGGNRPAEVLTDDSGAALGRTARRVKE